MDLQTYRKQIDKIDEELLRLFKKRMDVALNIAAYKKERGIPVFDPKREQEKLSSISDPYEKKLYSTLFELSRTLQVSQTLNSGSFGVPLSEPISRHKKILVINGPNLNMLGVREPELYGNQTYSDLVEYIKKVCTEKGVECECIQSNHEGGIVDAIQSARGKFDGIVINPAAYTHTSVAILDALKAVGIPAVEVHLTDIQEREDFRKVSYAGLACEMTFAGLGFEGYGEAIRWLVD
jgi:3-dehydroquinate dehydratase-2